MHQIGSLLAAPFDSVWMVFGSSWVSLLPFFGVAGLLSWARKITPNKFIISAVFSFYD